MRRPHSFLLTTLGLSAFAIASSATAAHAESADECVSIRTQEQSSGLAFDVKNACTKKVACSVAWTLSCTNASGKVTSSAKQEARFAVAPDTTHGVNGSATTCKDGWKIDDVSWDCSPASK